MRTRAIRVFDVATRVAMFGTGCLILLVGVALLAVAAVPVFLGSWLVKGAAL